MSTRRLFSCDRCGQQESVTEEENAPIWYHQLEVVCSERPWAHPMKDEVEAVHRSPDRMSASLCDNCVKEFANVITQFFPRDIPKGYDKIQPDRAYGQVTNKPFPEEGKILREHGQALEAALTGRR